jgi:tRNA(fMet)-specific endonuclease VapC
LTGYLLDSDWIIDCLRRKREAMATVLELQSAGLATSVICYAEVWEGVAGSTHRNQDEYLLEEFMSDVQILGVDIDVARVFGERRNVLRAQGNLIDNFDLLIAATALRNDLTLVTRNRRDFERIEGLRLHPVLS